MNKLAWAGTVGLPLVLFLMLGCQFGAAQNENFMLLVFSKTAGFRHDSIPAAIDTLRDLGQRGGFSIEASENAADFSPANLRRFKVVVFANTTGDILDGAQQAALEGFIAAGGGFVGIHSASDTEYDWPWYGGLVGAYFQSHPPGLTTFTLRLEDPEHPLVGGIPAAWKVTDEPYNFRTNPRAKVKVLMTADESSYKGGTMGADHPITWCHSYQGGRAWYTQLGHRAELYADPTFQTLLLQGVRYAAGRAALRC